METHTASPDVEDATRLPVLLDKPNVIKAPRDYFLGPVFAAARHAGRREITIGDKLYIVGGFHPVRTDIVPPALDVRHARAIFTLLSFREPYGDNGREIRFAFNDFCRRYANSQGGRYLRAIKAIIGELMDSYIQVTDLNTKLAHTYSVITARRPYRAFPQNGRMPPFRYFAVVGSYSKISNNGIFRKFAVGKYLLYAHWRSVF